MSKRGPSSKRKMKKESNITIVDKRDSAGERADVLDRVRKIGLIMDPSVPTTPEQIRKLTEEAAELHLIEPLVVLDRDPPVDTFGPTKEFLEAFLDVRKQMLENGMEKEMPDDVTYLALLKTVDTILGMVKDYDDEAVRLAERMNYSTIMGMYMGQPVVCEKIGMDGWDFFPSIYRKKAMERRAKEGSGE